MNADRLLLVSLVLREVSFAVRELNFLFRKFGIHDLDRELSIRAVESRIRGLICEQVLRSHLFLDLFERLSQLSFVSGEERLAAGALGDTLESTLINTGIKIVTDAY